MKANDFDAKFDDGDEDMMSTSICLPLNGSINNKSVQMRIFRCG